MTVAEAMPRSRPKDRALYVEAFIRAPMERVWELTQDPELHARWDARFTRIVPTGFLESGAQQFTYELAVPLHVIKGTGSSLGTKHGKRGERTSALLFDTDDPLSPLGAGRGYWRYVPENDGVRFITGYDYAPGWGALGRILDPLITRRFVWWLTALSFDRLRIWAEDGIEPERLPWWTAWSQGEHPVPRARRCLSRPPKNRPGTIMQDAPASLGHLESECTRA